MKKLFSANSLAEDIIVDTAINTVNKFPQIMSAALIAIGASTCGALSLCLGTLFHFLKLFKIKVRSGTFNWANVSIRKGAS